MEWYHVFSCLSQQIIVHPTKIVNYINNDTFQDPITYIAEYRSKKILNSLEPKI